MNRFIIGLFLLYTLFAAAQSAPAGVAFTSEPQTVAVGAISETITIQAQDGSGNAFKLPSTGCLALSSSASGEFSSSATSWSAVSVLTMNKNSANRNFYYKGTAAGTHTLTVRLVLKPESESRSCTNWPTVEWPTGWTTAQPITIGSGSNAPANAGENTSTASSTPQISEQASSASNGSSTSAPSEPVPSLVVKMSAPASVSVGADATFSATVFGVKREPIPNARVVWSFGNGATREGISIRYAYNIPGSYAVIADAASGGLSGTAKLVVRAATPDIRVSRAVPGVHGFVEVENRSITELDVSGWGIASGAILFTIPDHTLILPSAKVAFPSEVTKISLDGNDARLLFPNGTLAAEYVPTPNHVNIPRPPQADTPSKGEIKNSSLEGSTPTPVGGRDVLIPTTTPASIVLSVSDTASNSGIGKWLWAVSGACIVGIGALAAFRLKPLPQEESEEKEFAEEIQIV